MNVCHWGIRARFGGEGGGEGHGDQRQQQQKQPVLGHDAKSNV
jgi:hypothetical protein